MDFPLSPLSTFCLWKLEGEILLRLNETCVELWNFKSEISFYGPAPSLCWVIQILIQQELFIRMTSIEQKFYLLKGCLGWEKLFLALFVKKSSQSIPLARFLNNRSYCTQNLIRRLRNLFQKILARTRRTKLVTNTWQAFQNFSYEIVWWAKDPTTKNILG